jgi:DNA end-binding protein Ku
VSKTWKGSLSFGLISLPCYLTTGAREEGIALHMYHSKCKGSIKRPDYCPTCDMRRDDPNWEGEVEKGYETENGYLPVTKEELDSIKSENEKEIQIIQTVGADEVDPIYFNESYYLLPDKPGLKAYAVLVAALRASNCIALATLTKNQRDHVLALRPKGNGIVVHFLYYGTEVQVPAEFENLRLPDVKKEEAAIGKQLLESMEDRFEPEKFVDGYQQRLADLIDKKIRGVKPKKPAATKAKAAPAPDMLAALAASLAAQKGRKFRVGAE